MTWILGYIILVMLGCVGMVWSGRRQVRRGEMTKEQYDRYTFPIFANIFILCVCLIGIVVAS